MIFEVLGVSEHNKGALLMLEAVRDQVFRAFPDARIAVPDTMSKAARSSLDLLGVLPSGSGGVRTRIKRGLPKSLRRLLGIVRPDEVSVILDASGFGYGDFWGEGKLKRRLVDRLDGWRRAGRVAVMLPQALGPFETGDMPTLFKAAVSNLDLVWVRDDVSLHHVHKVLSASHIRRAPDFTNLLHPKMPQNSQRLSGACLVIPNEKVVTGDRVHLRSAYLDFLEIAVRSLQKSGRRPLVLVHEGVKDRQIADDLNMKLDTPLQIVDLPSPLDTKAVIGSAELIISSRFHGLVSALAAGVPSLACGWSHKYNELMEDYGVPEASILLTDPGSWQIDVDNFIASSEMTGYRKRLADKAKGQQAVSQMMWDDTIRLIRDQVTVS